VHKPNNLPGVPAALYESTSRIHSKE